MKFVLNVFFQELYDWMDVLWLAIQSFLWMWKQMFIFLEQLVFFLYFLPLVFKVSFIIVLYWVILSNE